MDGTGTPDFHREQTVGRCRLELHFRSYPLAIAAIPNGHQTIGDDDRLEVQRVNSLMSTVAHALVMGGSANRSYCSVDEAYSSLMTLLCYGCHRHTASTPLCGGTADPNSLGDNCVADTADSRFD